MFFPCTHHSIAPHLSWAPKPFLSAPQPPCVLGCLVPPPVATYFAGWSEPPPVNPAGLGPAAPEAPLCTPARSVSPVLTKGLSYRSRPISSCAAKTAQAQTTCQKRDEKERKKKSRSGAHLLFSLLSLAAIETLHLLHRGVKSTRDIRLAGDRQKRTCHCDPRF